jgi:predicted amidohydrolase
MHAFRIALANLRVGASREESVALAAEAIVDAGRAGAELVAFPECYVPGYRAPGRPAPPPDVAFLEGAWATLAAVCAGAKVTAAVGTERVVNGKLHATVVVIDREGTIAGFQDKVQIDPSEEGTYVPGAGRRLFRAGRLTFGVVICHEGWRYPETVRWAARRGAKLVLHPHFHEAEPGGYVPSTFADPASTFHEKAVLCRAAENTCYVASINAANPGAPTTSAVARPDGTLVGYQPYGRHGIFVADIDLDAATGLLASRCRSDEYGDD